MSEPFTLRVFVPSGDPESTRIIEKMNWTGRGYYVPRGDWPNVRTRDELAGPGVYVLLGHEQDEIGNEVPLAYIGQTDSLWQCAFGCDARAALLHQGGIRQR